MVNIYLNKEKINSLLIAIMLMSAILSGTFSLAFGVTENANLIILIVVMLLLVLKLFVSCKIDINLRKRSILLLFLIFTLYFLSVFFKGKAVNYNLVQLVFYAVIPVLCANLNFNTKLVCKYSLYLSLFTILGGNKFFEYQYSFMNQADMGYIYPLVTMLVIAMFHFRYYRKESDTNWFIWVCYLYNIYVLIRTCLVANRGALLTIIFTFFIIILYDFNKQGQMKKKGIKQIIICTITFICLAFVIFNLDSLLELLSNFFSQVISYVPSFILKMQRYIGFDDISNGRSEINILLFEAIKERPFYGYGMETFYEYSDHLYPFPHNFILQFIYEGGILFALIPVFFALWALIKVLFGTIKYKEVFIFSAILVCQCFPKLLFSTDAWMGTALWMLIAYSMNYLIKDNGKKCYYKNIHYKKKAIKNICNY